MGSSYRRLEVQLPQFWRVELATAEDEERKAKQCQGEAIKASGPDQDLGGWSRPRGWSGPGVLGPVQGFQGTGGGIF